MSKGDRTVKALEVRRRAVRKAQRRSRRRAARSAGVAAAAGSLALAGLTSASADIYPTPQPEHGIRLLADIARGDRYSFPRYLTNVRGTLFFIASDEKHGWELWKSDGTTSGTVMVKDIERGRDGSWPQELTAVGGKLYFIAYDGVHGREVWKSDGTRSGTVMVRNIHPSNADGYYPGNLTNVGGTLFFSAEDRTHGRALWKSNGTRRGTRLVEDIAPGAGPDGFGEFAAVGDRLFFSADDGVHGYELWRSDGTARGTALVKDIEPGEGDSAPQRMNAVGGKLFFAADDEHGRELWASDGRTSGTVLVKDITPPDWGNEGGPYPLGRLGDRFVFRATGEVVGTGVWTSNGTAAGTRFLGRVDPNTPGARVGKGRGAEIYFVTDYDGLWKTDGTPEGTRPVVDLPTYNACLHPVYCTRAGHMTKAGRSLYFTVHHAVRGTEVWTSNGTARGTGLLEDLYRGREGSYPSELTASRGVLFFVGVNARHGQEVFRVGGPPPPRSS
jgi:ELWxxDGT repeat protein